MPVHEAVYFIGAGTGPDGRGRAGREGGWKEGGWEGGGSATEKYSHSTVFMNTRGDVSDRT